MKNDFKENEKINGEVSKETEKNEVAGNNQSVVASKTNYLLIGIVSFFIFVFLIGGSFFIFRASRRFSPIRQQVSFNHNYNFNRSGFGHRNFMGRMMGVNSVSGKVIAVNGQTFTIDDNGQSRSVQINDTTRFSINSTTKINVNDQVVVWGLQNSSGVIQADHISVNPSLNY
jgi:hypothetical protein